MSLLPLKAMTVTMRTSSAASSRPWIALIGVWCSLIRQFPIIYTIFSNLLPNGDHQLSRRNSQAAMMEDLIRIDSKALHITMSPGGKKGTSLVEKKALP